MKKKTESKSDMARAMEMLENEGWTPGEVERRITPTLKRDLYGFADLIAIKPTDAHKTLAVQVTVESHVSHRLRKTWEEPNAKLCLECGWRVEIWGIRKKVDALGSLIKARSIILSPDGELRVVDASLVMLRMKPAEVLAGGAARCRRQC